LKGRIGLPDGEAEKREIQIKFQFVAHTKPLKEIAL
jgi:hypothetical protein